MERDANDGPDTSDPGTPSTANDSGTVNPPTDRLGTLRERAHELQATLADKLDHGADRLRQRASRPSSTASPAAPASNAIGEGTLVYASGATNARSADERMNVAANQLASGMTNTADWLRNGDLQKDIETQVRDHPGRSLLIALGVGYLIGKAFKR